MNKNYELVVILDPENSAEEQEKLLSKIKKVITDAEGKVSEAKEWGKKEFAYPIKKRRMGFFWLLTLDLPPEKVSPLRQKLSVEDKVLRYLMVNKQDKARPKEK